MFSQNENSSANSTALGEWSEHHTHPAEKMGTGIKGVRHIHPAEKMDSYKRLWWTIFCLLPDKTDYFLLYKSFLNI